jgi:hypothetical protein
MSFAGSSASMKPGSASSRLSIPITEARTPVGSMENSDLFISVLTSRARSRSADAGVLCLGVHHPREVKRRGIAGSICAEPGLGPVCQARDHVDDPPRSERLHRWKHGAGHRERTGQVDVECLPPCSMSSSPTSPTGSVTPAALTRIPHGPPSCRSAAATIYPADHAPLTSPATAAAHHPLECLQPLDRPPVCSARKAPQRARPQPARLRWRARPIPRPPPVTIATSRCLLIAGPLLQRPGAGQAGLTDRVVNSAVPRRCPAAGLETCYRRRRGR